MNAETAALLLTGSTIHLTKGDFAGRAIIIHEVSACPATTKASKGRIVAFGMATDANDNSIGYLVDIQADGGLVVTPVE